MERFCVPSVLVKGRCSEEAQMELLFQAWDELDDAVAAVRHVMSRYVVGEIRSAAVTALGALARRMREATANRRRNPRMRPA